MIPLKNNINVDNSDPANYPDGRIKDNTGTGNGTPVNRNVYGDLHANISKAMRLYGIAPTELPDNETNGYQIIDAFVALASKNDFIYSLTTDGTKLNVGIKLAFMKENEFLICKAAANKGAETTITGIDPGDFAVAYSGNFKTNEYVRLIKTNVGVSIIRIADWESLNAMVADFLYLKKASQEQEDAGAVDTVATTPLVNKVTFAKRVNGDDSDDYLASHTQNGLLSKEQWDILNSIGASPVKNIGWFSGLDVGDTIGALPVSGNLTAATAAKPSTGNSIVTVTLQNAMANLNYYVRAFIQGETASVNQSNDVGAPVFKVVSTTQFQLGLREIDGDVQNLKVHIEVVQL